MTRRRIIQSADGGGRLKKRWNPKGTKSTPHKHSRVPCEPSADSTGIVDVDQCVFCGDVFNTPRTAPSTPTINEFH